MRFSLEPTKQYTVVKWVSIIWLFGKKNNASKKIWEFVVQEIYRILVYENSKMAQKNAILYQPDTFVQFLSCALLCQPQKRSNVHFGSINVPNQRNPAQTCNFYCSLISKNYIFLQKNYFFTEILKRTIIKKNQLILIFVEKSKEKTKLDSK